MCVDLTKLPIFDRPTQKKVQAYVWIFDAYQLLETGKINDNSPFFVQVDQRGGSLQQERKYMSIK